ncbi:MAG: ERF family protein [Eubacteriales bacterium]|nr:ERF family protein [Eubacteriales bacterium]
MENAKIFKAIADTMNDVSAVGKNSKNEKQNYNFRGIDAVMNALHPAMVKNRIFVVPEVIEQQREERQSKNGKLIYSICKIKYTFFADDGSNISATVIGEGMDSGDKATNKAMSVAFKYACFQVFCIPTEDMTDPDAETPPPSIPVISVQQIEELKKEMMRTGVTAKTVLQMAKIATIEEMNLPTFEAIMKKFSKTPDKIPDPAPQDAIPDQLDDENLPFV